MATHAPSDADLLRSLDRALDTTGRLIAGVQPHQWSAPTPCSEWDARTLVNHLVSGHRNFTALVRGEPGPEHELTDGDLMAAYRSAAAELRAAFGQPGVLAHIYERSIGPVPGAVLVHLRITESLIHGWDLARATGQQSELPEDLAAQELALWRAQYEQGPGAVEGLPFAPAQPVADDAPAIDHLAAFLGRHV